MSSCIHIGDLYFLRGCDLLIDDDYEGAADALEKAYRLYPCNDSIRSQIIYSQLDLCYFNSDQHEKSESLHREVIKGDPLNAGAYCNLGSALAYQGKFNEAITQFQKASRFGHKRCEDLHLGLAKAYEGIKQHGQAIDEYRAALQADPFCFDALAGLKAILNKV